MNLAELIQSGASVKVEASTTDLINFAEYLIAKTGELCAMSKGLSGGADTETWLTNEEASKLCKVSKTTLWAWDKEGYLVASKMGRKKVYALSDINKILNAKNLRIPNHLQQQNKM